MGATLTPAQIAWYVTGGTGLVNGVYGMAAMPITPHNAQVAVAVALAESGGVVDNRGGPNSNGSYDWGLWQINDKAHSVSDLVKTNGGANWAMAYQISSRGTDWTPWTTFKNGKYLAFMPQAATAIASPDGSYQDTKEIPNTPGSAVGSILPKAWTQAATWERVGMAIAGVVLLALVMASIMGPSALKMVPATRALEAVAGGARKSHAFVKQGTKDAFNTVAGKSQTI